jgi:hypothetical protein
MMCDQNKNDDRNAFSDAEFIVSIAQMKVKVKSIRQSTVNNK